MSEDEKRKIKLIVETIETVIKKLQEMDDAIPKHPMPSEWDELHKSFKLYFQSVKDQVRRLRDQSKFLF